MKKNFKDWLNSVCAGEVMIIPVLRAYEKQDRFIEAFIKLSKDYPKKNPNTYPADKIVFDYLSSHHSDLSFQEYIFLKVLFTHYYWHGDFYSYENKIALGDEYYTRYGLKYFYYKDGKVTLSKNYIKPHSFEIQF